MTKFFGNKGIFVLIALIIFLPANLTLATTISRIGDACVHDATNSDCKAGGVNLDCETSSKKDGAGNYLNFCDCSSAENCEAEYGKPAVGTWDCSDGAAYTYDLDYCYNTETKEAKLPIEPNKNVSPEGKLIDAVFDSPVTKTALLEEVKTFKPTVKIKIPGLEFSDLKNTIDANGYIYVPWIGELIKTLYNFGLGIVSIVAVIMIIIQGVKIVIGGGEGKPEAYKKIGQIAIGLVIAWGSYAILYTINPSLVQFKSLRIKYIVPADIEVVEQGTDSNDAVGIPVDGVPAACLSQNNIVDIKNIFTLSGNAGANPYLHKDAVEGLKKAEEIAKKRGVGITVISAARTLERQTELWDEALVKYKSEAEAKKFVSRPSCNSPHLTGRAVDLCITGSSTCGKLSGKNAALTDPDITLLQDIMREAGWKRYCREWWHFEYGLNMPNRCSP